MHELSVATELLRLCEDRAGGQQLATVRIAVGELSSIDPSLIAFAWEAVVAGTRHQGARLDVDFRPARQHCPGCGEVAERQAGSWLRLCPRCDQPLQLRGGDELDLVEIVPVDARSSGTEVLP